MREPTLSTERVRRFYNWLGARHDLGERYERRAKARALDWLDARPGERVLNAGAGTGKEHAVLARAVSPGGLAVAVDLSRTMLDLTRARSGAPVGEADVRQLPFANDAFDAVYCSYVLDLMPAAALPRVLADFGRVVRPGGRLALVALAPGVDLASKVVIGLWQLAFRVSPLFLGGCRPIRLPSLVAGAGLAILAEAVIVQGGVPSAVVLARRPARSDVR